MSFEIEMNLRGCADRDPYNTGKNFLAIRKENIMESVTSIGTVDCCSSPTNFVYSFRQKPTAHAMIDLTVTH